ncbi:MAG: HNH endonuclease signature motif containing protein, partial [Planctomycetota bacterium]
IWLERRMDALPELREALSGRVLTYTKALFVAKDACPSDVAERIARAASTTLQQTERESDEDEERQNRADGVRRLWGPKEAFEVLSAVITGCREMVRARGEVVSAGEALARLADEFTETWGEEVKRIRKNMPKGRWEVMWRNGGLCAFPGCTRPAVHDHHVRFRSRGGSDDVSNRAPLCIPHHLRAIHRRWARLSGRAGVRLKWEFGVGLGGGEEFVTVGEDDVVRVG